MVGKFWSHTVEAKRAIGEKARARWAARQEKERQAIGEKISKAKKGAVAPRMSEEGRLARAEKIRAHWASLTPEERKARGRKAQAARSAR